MPVVRTAILQPLQTPREIDLTGSTQAFDSATLYARATGYINKRNVDIGSRVHAGEVLAVIAAPDLDQQLAQARAQLVQLQAALVQSQANMELARVTDRRQSQLTTLGWTSQQGGDQARLSYASSIAAVGVARANVQAQQAQVGQLEQLTGFERVVAPFDGVITSRQIDVGSLVTANANSGTPLFSIAHTNVLRVQIYVPQTDYFGLKDGQQAEVTVPELPGRTFHGRLARNASALQDATRTMLAEVDVDNQDGALAPGIYTVVHLQEPRLFPVISVPSQALVFDKDGLQAAVYQDGVARMRHLDVAADNVASAVKGARRFECRRPTHPEPADRRHRRRMRVTMLTTPSRSVHSRPPRLQPPRDSCSVARISGEARGEGSSSTLNPDVGTQGRRAAPPRFPPACRLRVMAGLALPAHGEGRPAPGLVLGDPASWGQAQS